jgi:cytochrome c biogenesis protein CcdA
MADITLIKIITLAAADAINPCAFAVMTMVLVSILLANPNKKHKVLIGGLAFTLAVFIGYFFYGLVMVQLFKSFIEFTSNIYPYLTKALAIFAIVLGIFNIKDFIKYQPGGIATEMPLSFRPRVKQITKSVTSPMGAFISGIFVTLFLLPCTIGPYIIATGSLSNISNGNIFSIAVLKVLVPWLLLYNFIFILPMIGITLIVYFGISTTENLSEWKDRRIKYIHLITGLLLIGLGIAILTGLI